MTDRELLKQFVRDGSQQAFTRLVERYAGLVYSAAIRQVRRSHVAEDVTQIVFIALATKAARLPPDTVLSAWLHKVTRYVALDQLKAEQRRAARERRLAQMQQPSEADAADARIDPEWDRLSPQLDRAVSRLSKSTRAAVLIRFFEGKTLREVGERLGISEEAAKVRVFRGVQQLRAILAKQGVTSAASMSALALGELITARGAIAAPADISSRAAAAALAHAPAAHVAAAKGALIAMAWTKTKIVAACAAGLLLAGGTSVAVNQYVIRPRRAQQVVLMHASQSPTVVILPENSAPAPTGPIRGIVRGPDGRPVAGAIVIGINWSSVEINDALENKMRDGKSTLSLADGAFSFDDPKDIQNIAVVCAQGYASTSLKRFRQAGELVIVPWARIDGTVYLHGKPAVGTEVRAGRIGGQNDGRGWGPGPGYEARATTDSNGHFMLEHVPPGTQFMSCSASPRQFINGWTRVPPGGSGHLIFGPTPGVDIRGRVSNAGEQMQGMLMCRAPKPSDPAAFYVESYQVFVDPDGSFVLRDIPAGKYNLYLNKVSKQTLRPIASVTRDIEVKDSPAGADRAPDMIELGELKLEPQNQH